MTFHCACNVAERECVYPNCHTGKKSAASPPPAQEDELVEPIAQKSQYQDQRGRWYDCPDDDMKYYANMGNKTRVLYMYVDYPKLYTRPKSD